MKRNNLFNITVWCLLLTLCSGEIGVVAEAPENPAPRATSLEGDNDDANTLGTEEEKKRAPEKDEEEDEIIITPKDFLRKRPKKEKKTKDDKKKTTKKKKTFRYTPPTLKFGKCESTVASHTFETEPPKKQSLTFCRYGCRKVQVLLCMV